MKDQAEKGWCEEHSNCQENAIVVRDWKVGGCGGTLERIYKCSQCGRVYRAVYIYSHEVDDATGETLADNF